MVPNKILDDYLKKIAKGDKEALEKLYLKTSTAVYAFALSILKNKVLAEDTLQDVFIKIYDNADTYQSKDKPLAWILTITKNISLMKLRKEKKHKDIDLYKDILGNDKDNPDNKLFLSYLFEQVTEEERDIVLLHIVSGLKHKEIAQILSIPLGTVLSKYKRTISKLQKIGKEGLYA